MIVPMKKVTLLTSLKYREASLIQLRRLGVLHIQDVKPPVSEDIQSLEAKLDNVDRALQIIPQLESKPKEVLLEQARSYVEQALSLSHQKEGFQRELAEFQEINKWFESWGNVSYRSIQQLKAAGIFVRLYVADKSLLKRLPADKMIHIEKEENGTFYLALFGQNPDDKLDLKEEQIPEIEPAEIRTKISQSENEINQVDQQLYELAGVRDSLTSYKNDLTKRLTLNRVKYGMGEEAGVSFLQGFCPEDVVPDIQKTAIKEGWGYIVQDPDDPSEVPTVIRNPKWIRIIEPLFKFMGTLPGYQEQDVSLVFLAFFSVFYALIVGDAGYGLIFLTATFLIDRRTKSSSREFFYLMYVVSFVTIIWGTITGTWFGSEKIAQLPFLKIFIIDQISSFNPESTSFIMQLTFIIGVVHLSIGHLLRALKKSNSITAIADLGWILVLWGVYFIANNIVLGKEMAKATMPLLIAGASIILIFANFQKNIIKGILITLGNLPLSIISSFSDIVSYIRLFAVGLATVVVATSFNEMAIGSGINSIVSGIIAAIILLLGHSINLVLCGMSILVHGVRLNMLEFSGHVGVQWTGKPYQPFKE
jgi:V/A-type H+-transporting ATPase subunit I